MGNLSQRNKITSLVKLQLVLLFLLGCNIGFAQSLEQMQKQFPNKLAIFSNVNRFLDLDIKKGIPNATSTEISEIMILDEKGNGLFSKGRVYHSSFNELKKVEAYTVVPEGSSTKKLKVTDFKTQSSTSQGVFYDDVKETAFDYARMNVGSISHVESEHFNKDVRFLNKFYFSNYLDVANANFNINYPEEIDLRYIIKNDHDNIIKVTESNIGKKKKLTFTASNIADYKFFDDGTSMSYDALHVIVYVASYKNSGETVPVFGSVDRLYNWNVNFLETINQQPDINLKKIADSLCQNKKSASEKAQAIYLWVQGHIKYVAFENGLEGFIPRHAADVYTKRYGDCKDMASILTALCRLSGLEAYFTWIGTRSIPYTYAEVPLPIADNHMICTVKINGKWIFLDATDASCIFGFPTSAIQGKEALISLSKEKYELVKVPTIAAEANAITDSTTLIIENTKLLGKSSVTYTGYLGSDVYSNLLYHKGEDERQYAKRKMGKGSNKFLLNDYEISLSETQDKNAKISGHFEIPDYVKSIGEEIYINLNLEKLFNNNVIDAAKRKVAVENEYLYTINQIHSLKIPDGYNTDFVPANTEISNDLVYFSIKYSKENGSINATQKMVMKKLYIEPNDFDLWNKTVGTALLAYKEQVVLKKK